MVIFDELNNNINIKVKKIGTKAADGIKIVINDCTKAEGDPDPEFTATVEFGDVNSNKKILYDYELTRVAGEAAGVYDITLKSIDYENAYVYSSTRFLPMDCVVEPTIVNGTLTITKTAAPVEPYAYDDHSSIKCPISFTFNNKWHDDHFSVDNFLKEEYLVSGYNLSELDNQLSAQSCDGIRVSIRYTDGSEEIRNISITNNILPFKAGSVELWFHNNDFEYTVPYTNMSYIEYIVGDNMTDNAVYYAYTSQIIDTSTALAIEMFNIVDKYIIAIKFSGTGFNKIIYPYCRACLSGMASNVKVEFNNIEYSGNANIVIDGADADYISRENNKINLILNTFGISSDESRQNILSIDLMLFPHTIKTFEFDVTDQLTAYPRGGIITVDIDEDL